MALEQAAGAPEAALLVDGAGTALAPARTELERLEPFGQGFPEPQLVVQGRIEGPARSFGQGHRKFRLEGDPAELTLFAGGGEDLDGPLCLAVSPMDSARWGRSWRVDSFLASGEAP